MSVRPIRRLLDRTTGPEPEILPVSAAEPAPNAAESRPASSRRRAAHDAGPRAFTTLWTAQQIAMVPRAKLSGAPLAMTSGGPHHSAPSFVRAGVRPGDIVMPIQVKDGRLHVIAAMRVTELPQLEEFVARRPGEFLTARSHPEFQRLLPHLESDHQQAFWLVRLWLEGQADLAAVCPGEVTELVLGEGVLPISLTRAAPPDLVLGLRWQSGRRPERAIRHLTPEGRIQRALTLQGIYQLTQESEAALLALA